MRILLISCCLLALAGCGASPAALGITGPGQMKVPPPSQPVEQGTDAVPGVSTVGTFYGPTNGGPQTGASGYWGYN